MAVLPRIIAALHLLPSAHTRRGQTYTTAQIVQHALLHAQIAYAGGVRAAYLQDVHDTPVAPQIRPQTVETVTAVGQALRSALPELQLGVCLMQHGAREPLQIAHAIGAQFVRLKVYMGVMVKAEGLLSGCAYEAIQARAELGIPSVRIFADVYDRVGTPLAPLPLGEACRQAVVFGQADGLVLTGATALESAEMIGSTARQKLGVPLILGGGAKADNAQQFAAADHIVVAGAFYKTGLPARAGLPIEWDTALVAELVRAYSP